MGAGTNKASLNTYYLLIAVAPAIVFVINQLLLQYVVQPFDLLPARLAEFDVHKEGAARIGMLAALLLFIGGALGALVFFAYTLRMLALASRLKMIGAFAVLAGAAIAVGCLTQGREPLDHVGKSLACIATGYDEAQSVRARADELAQLKASPRTRAIGATPPGSPPAPPVQAGGVAVEHLVNRQNCAHERFERIRQLGAWQFYLLVIAFSGLVFGAICCLATMPGKGSGTAKSRELRHWEKQSEWLNTYLYLAALLLGTTLVFINAYLRLPAFVLSETASYDAHVAALVSYYGFAFTVMLAAFYIPVATILSSKVNDLKPATSAESKLPAAFTGPIQILKIVLGLFSTALAGVLPGILSFIA